MSTHKGIDIARIKAIKTDIISLSREPKLSKVIFPDLTVEQQKELKRVVANYNHLIKIALDLVLEVKDYSKTTFVFNEDDALEYNALMAIIEE